MEGIKITKRCKGRSIKKESFDCKFYTVKAGQDKNGKQRIAYVIATFNNAHTKITTTDYVGICILPDFSRIYFETETKANGFKLSRSSTSLESTRFIRFSTDCAPDLMKYLGEYNLEFDEKEKLHYIKLIEKTKENENDSV